MRLLLDTHVVLGWLADARLGETARSTIATADDVLVSAVTGYEIEFKRNLGKLKAPAMIPERIDECGFSELPVALRHAVEAGVLPVHHRDPFDRILVAQARCDGLTLVTADRKLDAYDVSILPADR